MTVSTNGKISKTTVSTTGSSAVPIDIKTNTKRRVKAHPHPYLADNFYPIFEETVGDEGIECQVVGTLPSSLSKGQYVRTGPNSIDVPSDTAYHHWFDGAGMLHGVYFVAPEDEEDATIQPRYINRFVRSDVFTKTNLHGRMVLSLGQLEGSGSLISTLAHLIWYQLKSAFYGLKTNGDGNTALTFVQSRLLALQEAGMPVEAAVPSLDTVGHYFFEDDKGRSSRSPKQKGVQPVVTAHPKIDPKTGEFIFFSWQLTFPHAVYSVVSPEGKKVVWEQPIAGITKTSMMHDIAVTPNYSVIIHVPFLLDPPNNIKNGKPLISFNENEPTRFGIIPRYYDAKKDQVIWFESRASHIFHTANAWDETDTDGNVVAVCMTAARAERMVSDIILWQKSGPGSYGGGKTKEELKKTYGAPGSGDYSVQDPDGTYLTLYRFDIKTKEVQMTTLCSSTAEFPVINYGRYMQPDLQYVYGATILEGTPGVGLKIDGIVKTDVRAILAKKQGLERTGQLKNAGGEGRWELGAEVLQEVEKTARQVHKFGPHMYGGEALFVPNIPRADGQPLAEDDGHLLVYVYDERQLDDGVAKKDQWTELWVFDAKKIGQDIEPVAKVRIPRRIPYGFHGLWVTKEQIEANKQMREQRRVSTA
ncbi:hypothetical protein BGZ82_009439 [Podila clonocystis]|nr:hypothetical protein BGZ82_009439 [Podila clonocystis]